MNAFFVSAAAVCVVVIACWAIKSKEGGKCVLLSALQGIAAIFAVNIIGMVSGVTVAVNLYTVGTGAILGMPGVIGILMLNTFL